MRNPNHAKFLENEPGIPLMARNFTSRHKLKNKQALEVGMGWGSFAYWLLERDAIVTGTEVTENDLFTAKSDHRLVAAKLQVADGLSLPFPDQTFDFVFAWEVLEHIPKKTENQFFREIYRVLKPDGFFLMSTPNNDLRSKFLDPAFWLTRHRHYDVEALNEYSLLAGFRASTIHAQGGLYLGIWTISMYFSKWILRKNNVLDCAWFSKRLKNEEFYSKGWMSLFAEFQK